MISQITDHTAQALGRLLDQYRRSTKFRALIASYVDRLQNVEDTLWDILEVRTIDGPAWVLNGLGVLLNEPRGGLSDDDYRIALRVKILVLKSSGTADQLIEIGTLSIPGGYTFTLTDVGGNATLLVSIPEAVLFTAAIFLRNLIHAKTGGVKLIFEWSPDEPADTFRWTDGPGFGSVYDASTGGYLVSWTSV